MTATCLRCDWKGEIEWFGVPSVRHAALPARSERTGAARSTRPSGRAGVEPVEGPAEPPFHEARPAPSNPRTILLVTAVVFSVVAFLLARGGLDPGPTSAAGPSRVPLQTGGRLVYTVPVGDSMARVWRWNLATDEVSKGPLVPAPITLVNVRSTGHGWLGVTSHMGAARNRLRSSTPSLRTPRPSGSAAATS